MPIPVSSLITHSYPHKYNLIVSLNMFNRRSECHRYKRRRSAESSRISNVRRQLVECEQWQWRRRRRRIHISSNIQRHRRCTKRLAQSISILNYQNMKPLAIFFLLISLCLASIVMVYTLFLLPCARFFIFRYSFVVVCLFFLMLNI